MKKDLEDNPLFQPFSMAPTFQFQGLPPCPHPSCPWSSVDHLPSHRNQTLSSKQR